MAGREVGLALAAAERMYLSPLAERVALAEEAVDLGRRSDDPATFLWVVARRRWAVAHPLTLHLRTEWLTAAAGVLAEHDDPVLAFWIHSWSMAAALERADGASLDDQARRAEQIADRIPDATIRWNCTMYQAWLAGVRGRVLDHANLADAALEAGIASGQPDAVTMYGGQILGARYFQGRLHEMIPLIEQAMPENPGLPVFGASLALATAHCGELERARALLAQSALGGFEMPDDPQWAIGLGCWAEAAAVVGAVDVAPALRSMLLPYADQIAANGNGILPSVAHFLGLLDHLLGELDSADLWFAAALDLHDRLGSPVLVAQRRAAWASLLVDRGSAGDPERAREMAKGALAAAIEGGYGSVERAARSVLDRLA